MKKPADAALLVPETAESPYAVVSSGISAPAAVPGGGGGEAQDVVTVSVFAPDLAAVDVHYTDPAGHRAVAALSADANGTHHGLVAALRPGASYAFWARGADLPDDGQLLLDPFARAIIRDDDGAYWGVHVTEDFDWGGDAAPAIPWRDTVI